MAEYLKVKDVLTVALRDDNSSIFGGTAFPNETVADFMQCVEYTDMGDGDILTVNSPLSVLNKALIQSGILPLSDEL